MKAICTKYLCATNFKPARIVAKAEGVKPVYLSYDSEYDANRYMARQPINAHYRPAMPQMYREPLRDRLEAVAVVLAALAALFVVMHWG